MKGKHNFKLFYYIHNCRNTYPKGRALMQMYRVVPKTKREVKGQVESFAPCK